MAVDLDALADDLRTAGFDVRKLAEQIIVITPPEGGVVVKSTGDVMARSESFQWARIYVTDQSDRSMLSAIVIIARHLTGQPDVPVDAIARLVANGRVAELALKFSQRVTDDLQCWVEHWGDGTCAETKQPQTDAYNELVSVFNDPNYRAIQPNDCDDVRAWLETIKGVGE